VGDKSDKQRMKKAGFCLLSFSSSVNNQQPAFGLLLIDILLQWAYNATSYNFPTQQKQK
jgi:hypothetical protein